MKQPGFEARLLPSKTRWYEPPHQTVWVRLDLGNGPEWVVVARIKG